MSKSAPSTLRPAEAPARQPGEQQASSPGYYCGTVESLDPSASIGILVKQLQSSITRMMDQRMAPMGLTATQWRPLALVRYYQINTPAELSRRTEIDTGAMTRALDRLEAKQFITRKRCPEDRRSVRIELTDAGNQVAEQILPAVAETLNNHLRGFSPEEVELFIGMVSRMIQNGEQEP